MSLDDNRVGFFAKINRVANSTAVTVVYPGPFRERPNPQGDGYYELQNEAGPRAAKRVILVPFGTAANDKTFTMEVYSIRKTLGDPAIREIKAIYVAIPIASFLCTLGALTGLDHGYILNTEFFCDTIVPSTAAIGIAGVDYNIRNATDDTIASVDVAVYGGSLLAVMFGVGSSQAVDANALVAPL
jgi:hypothetical protein